MNIFVGSLTDDLIKKKASFAHKAIRIVSCWTDKLNLQRVFSKALRFPFNIFTIFFNHSRVEWTTQYFFQLSIEADSDIVSFAVTKGFYQTVRIRLLYVTNAWKSFLLCLWHLFWFFSSFIFWFAIFTVVKLTRRTEYKSWKIKLTGSLRIPSSSASGSQASPSDVQSLKSI